MSLPDWYAGAHDAFPSLSFLGSSQGCLLVASSLSFFNLAFCRLIANSLQAHSSRGASCAHPARLGRGDDGRGLDFDLGPLFYKRHHLDQGHGWEVTTDHAAIGLPNLLETGDVLALVGDVPGEAHEVLRQS